MKRQMLWITTLISLCCPNVFAQGGEKLIDYHIKEFGETWFSSYQEVRNYKGESIIKEKYGYNIESVGDVFFNMIHKNTLRNETGKFQEYLTIYRTDSKGNLIDSILVKNHHFVKKYPSGLCLFPQDQEDSLYFLPAKGPLIRLQKNKVKQEFTGIPDDITLWIEPVPEEDCTFRMKTQTEINNGTGIINPASDSIAKVPASLNYEERCIKRESIYNTYWEVVVKVRKNPEGPWNNLCADSTFTSCYLFPDSISGLGKTYYLFIPNQGKKQSVLLNKFQKNHKSNYYPDKSFLLIPAETVKRLYHADINTKNLDLLTTEACMIDEYFRILKTGSDTLVYDNGGLFISRNGRKRYASFLHSNEQQSTRRYEIISVADVFECERGFSAVLKVNYGYHLMFGDRQVANFSELKMPVSKDNEIIYIGKNPEGQIQVLHTLLTGYYFEEDPTEAIKKGFDDLPDFSYGLPEMLKDSAFFIRLLKTYSPSSIDLIGWIDAGYGDSPTFNPKKLNADSVEVSIKETTEALIKKVKVTGITATGRIIEQIIPLPPLHYHFVENSDPNKKTTGSEFPGILKKPNGDYDFFIPCKRFTELKDFKKPVFLLSAQTRKTYRMENHGTLHHLWQSPSLLKDKKFPEKFYGVFYYVFRDEVPVALTDAFPQIHDARLFGNKILLTHSGSGFMDKNGKMQVMMTCNEGSCENQNPSFKSGLAVIKFPLVLEGNLTSTIQFIDKTGKKAFEKDLQCSTDFHDGLAFVVPLRNTERKRLRASFMNDWGTYYKPGEWDEYLSEIINTKGELICKVRTDTYLYKEGYISNLPDTLPGIGFYNHRNQLVKSIPNHRIRFKGPRVRTSGKDGFMAEESKSRLITYFDLDGNLLLKTKLKFDNSIAGDFSCNMALVRIGGYPEEWYYLNLKGEELFKEKKLTDAHDFLDGRAFVEDSLGWYIINTEGQRQGNEKFQYVSDFKEGLARIKNEENRFCYVDTTGTIVIKPIFTEASDFSEGLAFVTDTTGTSYFIDQKGSRQSFPHEFIGASEFSEGLCYVSTQVSKSLINIQNGNIETFDEKMPAILKQYIAEGYKITYWGPKYAVVSCNPYDNKVEQKLVTFE